MQALVLILWSLPVAAWALPRVYAKVCDILDGGRSMRGNGGFATVYTLMVVAAAFHAYPSRAAKGDPPEPPKPPVAEAQKGVIRLYYHAPDGRLVPFDAPVRREGEP